MPVESDRQLARKRVYLVPDGSDHDDGSPYVDVLVTTQISFTADGSDQYQETQYKVDNSGNSGRTVSVGTLNPVTITGHATDEYGNSYETGTVSDASFKIKFERVLKWPIQADGSDLYWENENTINNKDGEDLVPPHFAHLKTHVFRYVNPNNSAWWIDVDVIDQISFVGDGSTQYQEVVFTLSAPDQQADPSLPEISDSGNGIDPPWRLDPFQNVVNFLAADDYIIAEFDYATPQGNMDFTVFPTGTFSDPTDINKLLVGSVTAGIIIETPGAQLNSMLLTWFVSVVGGLTPPPVISGGSGSETITFENAMVYTEPHLPPKPFADNTGSFTPPYPIPNPANFLTAVGPSSDTGRWTWTPGADIPGLPASIVPPVFPFPPGAKFTNNLSATYEIKGDTIADPSDLYTSYYPGGSAMSPADVTNTLSGTGGVAVVNKSFDWSTVTITYQGKHYRAIGAYLEPRKENTHKVLLGDVFDFAPPVSNFFYYYLNSASVNNGPFYGLFKKVVT